MIKRIFLIFVLGMMANAAQIKLSGTWQFMPGDDSLYSSVTYQDSSWWQVPVPAAFSEFGFSDYDGFAWYRLTFSLDSLFLTNADSLVLTLGRINDIDETWLNGRKIGATGTLLPHPVSESGVLRQYIIPDSLLVRENVLAVRVLDISQEGGIYQGPVSIRKIDEARHISSQLRVPKKSAAKAAFTNGMAAAVYDFEKRRFSRFNPHIFHKYDAASRTPDLLNLAEPVVYRNGKVLDLSLLKIVEEGYIEGTGIIKQILKSEDYKITLYGFCPFVQNDPFWCIYLVVDSPKADEFSLNFRLEQQDPRLKIGKWAYKQKNRKWLTLFMFFDAYDSPGALGQLNRFKNQHPGFSALVKEIRWWKAFHKRTDYPDGITAAEKRIYVQSLALMKMAQSRDEFPARGQIVAALPSGNLNFCRTHDMCYSINAYIAAGHFEEALAGLQFLMNSRTGKYSNYRWFDKDYGIRVDYGISVMNYFGNGEEYSEETDQGRNFILSNFGLVLWTLRQYTEKTEDIAFVEYYWSRISRQIADVLVKLIDETDLIRPDSGPWFQAVTDNHFAYTSICAYRGLLDAAWLARSINDYNRAEKYEAAADQIRIAMETQLLDNEAGIFKSYLEVKNPDEQIDGSVVEAMNWIFTIRDPVTLTIIRNFEDYLALDNTIPGFRRRVGGSWYNRQENPFLNLRIVKAYLKQNNIQAAETLRNRMTNQARLNMGMIPEYFDEHNARYLGNTTMIGLGSAAYILSFWRE